MKKITEGCFHTMDKQISTVSLFAANLCAYANQPWQCTFLYEAKHNTYRCTACIFLEMNGFFSWNNFVTCSNFDITIVHISWTQWRTNLLKPIQILTLFITFLLKNFWSKPCIGSPSHLSWTQRKCCWTSRSEPWRWHLAIVPSKKQFSWK